MMTNSIDASTTKDLLKGFVIPPRPQIVADIQIEAAMPDPDINVIASIVAKDAGISGSLIKAINSPLFGLSGTIRSISHAAGLMGLDSVVSIVTSLSLKSVLSDDNVTGLNRFWDIATDVARASVLVSNYLEIGSPDEAYSLGLFHDCGIALMLLKYPNYLDVLEKAYQAGNKSVVDVENEEYKTDHSVLGYYVSKTWKLPEHITEVISHHHYVENIFGIDRKRRTKTKDLLLILKISEHISGSCRILGASAVDHEWQRIGDEILDYGGLVEDDILNMADECKDAGIGLF